MSRLRSALVLTTLGIAPLGAQLPYLTVPSGTLRIELGGSFLPVTQEFADGETRRLGDPIAGAPLFGTTLGPRLTELLGRPASPGSTGSVTAELMQQRGIGTIGLGVGIGRRLTLGVRIPVVSVRTEWSLASAADGATVGFNPALAGDGGSQAFADQFEAALATVQSRRDAGAYDGDPALRALADRILSEGPVWRARFVATVLTPSTAERVLPLAASTDGTELLAQAADWRDQISGPLGVEGFTSLPTLPLDPVTSEQIGAALTSPSGFGLVASDEQPLVGIGDVEFEAHWLLLARSDTATGRWTGAWLHGGVTAPTGTPPRADRLRDLGTGDGQLDLALGATAEVGSGRLGLRASAMYRNQLAGDREARVAGRDEFLVPASRTATLRWDPGNEVHVQAQPFFRIADRFALTGTLRWWRRGADAWSAPGGATDPAITAMGANTEASAVVVGAGLAYAHHGVHVDGVPRMPVEAGLGIERTVASGSGLVAKALTTRVWFRVYGRLW
jgi:hypothetical protein